MLAYSLSYRIPLERLPKTRGRKCGGICRRQVLWIMAPRSAQIPDTPSAGCALCGSAALDSCPFWRQSLAFINFSTRHSLLLLFPTPMSRFASFFATGRARNLLLSLLAFLLPPLHSPAATGPHPAPPIPEASQILARLNRAHPRLLASEKEFANLKESVKSDPQLQK